MHRSCALYKCGLFKTVYNCYETGFGCIQVFLGRFLYVEKYVLVLKSYTVLTCMSINPAYMCVYSSSYDLVFGSVRGLHCTWLVPLLGEQLFGNRALLWCLAGIDYEMPKFDSDDLVVGSGPCPSSPTVALCVSLHSGVEPALMCLDSLKLSSCARSPHVGSSTSFVKITKESVFLVPCMNCFRETASALFQRNH
ncbi:hypothetical protein M9H77_13454 [Catharanthus roseus]|uniref:Uncharacterized protein n=1 Tax=Catharanthus roseus TaxID=4058 RepID=A0ACC0BKA0_CATRO|nr:hypothetical protein M9H77_13454 [Catharanthus roseus]